MTCAKYTFHSTGSYKHVIDGDSGHYIQTYKITKMIVIHGKTAGGGTCDYLIGGEAGCDHGGERCKSRSGAASERHTQASPRGLLVQSWHHLAPGYEPTNLLHHVQEAAYISPSAVPPVEGRLRCPARSILVLGHAALPGTRHLTKVHCPSSCLCNCVLNYFLRFSKISLPCVQMRAIRCQRSVVVWEEWEGALRGHGCGSVRPTGVELGHQLPLCTGWDLDLEICAPACVCFHPVGRCYSSNMSLPLV